MRNDRRNEKFLQIGVEGVAALCAILFPVAPVVIGVGIGILIIEVIEGVQDAIDEAAG